MSSTTIALGAVLRQLTLAVVFAGGCGESQSPDSAPPDAPAGAKSVPLVFEDVNVIAMTSDAILPGRTVVISDGRIAAIGDRTITRPTGAIVISGRGRYLLPALIDMHVHIRTPDVGKYVSFGITTVRNMWGWQGLQDLATRIDRGEVVGPRIISASPGLDGLPVQWPETRVVMTSADVPAAVKDQVQAGWRYLKVYTRLSRENYQAIMAEARAAGIPVVGHVPWAVPIEEALALGQTSIEHLTGYETRFSRSGRTGTLAWLDANPALYSNLAQASARAGVWNCPTLAIYSALAQQHTVAEHDEIVRQRRAFVLELHRAGAKLLAGSDAGIGVVEPGAVLHAELAELVAAGLTPYQALRAATIDAGSFLGITGLGTVQQGAPADLLLVDGNPLANIAKLQQFDGLVQRGAWTPAGPR
jgi:imidazolonepropionase-like amidohydrolase